MAEIKLGKRIDEEYRYHQRQARPERYTQSRKNDGNERPYAQRDAHSPRTLHPDYR
jgi:hypothetical protein